MKYSFIFKLFLSGEHVGNEKHEDGLIYHQDTTANGTDKPYPYSDITIRDYLGNLFYFIKHDDKHLEC